MTYRKSSVMEPLLTTSSTVIALLEIYLASQVRHQFGIVIATANLFSRIIGQKLGIERPFPRLHLIRILSYYTILLLAIQILSLDLFHSSHVWASFPEEYQASSLNTVLVTETVTFRAQHLVPTLPYTIPIASELLVQLIEEWSEMNNARIMKAKPGFLWIKCSTRLIGFVDDLAVAWEEVGHHKLILRFRGQSRVGVRDSGSNYKRLRTLVNFLEKNIKRT
ncbi:hypothetical protein BKA69DRAFT_1051014 [Paraphysoderma sedebokerense]|nr:hypothetical protein BKA69DRAFT_1051014 [Paraphysoderma sedebokerense]